MRYFIGNWKMFGVPKSINIIKKINNFVKKDKNTNKISHVICLNNIYYTYRLKLLLRQMT